MKILKTANTIRNHLKRLKPARVAVAYIGAGWRSYIDTDALEEVVVSPTLGSNPKAIEELIRHLGVERVHFLSRLHAKIYLATDRALVGSCNLSDNALAQGRLLEVAVAVNDAKALADLNNLFEQYRKDACNEYPTAAQKHMRLRRLVSERFVAERNGLLGTRRSLTSIKEYNSTLDRIHVCWYQPEDVAHYSKSAIAAAIPDSRARDLDDMFSQSLYFLEGDHVRVNDWILCWHERGDGTPRKNGSIDWMRAHYVIPHGVVGSEPYSKLVVEMRTENPGTPPFKLDGATKELIRRALTLRQFCVLRSSYKDPWRLADADRMTAEFLAWLKAHA